MNEAMKEKVEMVDKMPPLAKVRLLALLEDDNEKKARLKPIYEAVEGSGLNRRKDRVLDIYEIGEEFQIVKVEQVWSGEKEIIYTPFINFRRQSVVAHTLEEAMVILIALKHDDFHAVPYACRVLNIGNNEK